MSQTICCFRCGASLAALPLPLSRRDECPECSAELHVCRMCQYYDPGVPQQCTEDGAEEVLEKTRVNFCDWFVPSESAYDPALKARSDHAAKALGALFGEGEDQEDSPDASQSEAEKLFR